MLTDADRVVMALFTLTGVGILTANLLVLWISIKLYSEVLKVDHIKQIGKG